MDETLGCQQICPHTNKARPIGIVQCELITRFRIWRWDQQDRVAFEAIRDKITIVGFYELQPLIFAKGQKPQLVVHCPYSRKRPKPAVQIESKWVIIAKYL